MLLFMHQPFSSSGSIHCQNHMQRGSALPLSNQRVASRSTEPPSSELFSRRPPRPCCSMDLAAHQLHPKGSCIRSSDAVRRNAAQKHRHLQCYVVRVPAIRDARRGSLVFREHAGEECGFLDRDAWWVCGCGEG